MTTITDYQSLLTVGKQQKNPQRFLFVFLQTSVAENHNAIDQQNFHAGQGGELTPIMCVDKNLDELTNFEDLVTESEQMQQEWDLVLIATLAGTNGMLPSAEETEQQLKIMVQSVQSGGDLSKYLLFDKSGVLMHFT